MEIIKEIRLAIYGKDQLRKNWYLISLKPIFVRGFLFSYFYVGVTCPEEGAFFNCRKNKC